MRAFHILFFCFFQWWKIKIVLVARSTNWYTGSAADSRIYWFSQMKDWMVANLNHDEAQSEPRFLLGDKVCTLSFNMPNWPQTKWFTRNKTIIWTPASCHFTWCCLLCCKRWQQKPPAVELKFSNSLSEASIQRTFASKWTTPCEIPWHPVSEIGPFFEHNW